MNSSIELKERAQIAITEYNRLVAGMNVKTSKHRFKVDQVVLFRGKDQEYVKIQKLTQINGYPAYWTYDLPYRIADHDCIECSKVEEPEYYQLI